MYKCVLDIPKGLPAVYRTWKWRTYEFDLGLVRSIIRAELREEEVADIIMADMLVMRVIIRMRLVLSPFW